MICAEQGQQEVLIHNLEMPDYLFLQLAARGLLTREVAPPPPDASGKGGVWTVGGQGGAAAGVDVW